MNRTCSEISIHHFMFFTYIYQKGYLKKTSRDLVTYFQISREMKFKILFEFLIEMVRTLKIFFIEDSYFNLYFPPLGFLLGNDFKNFDFEF